MNVGGGIAGGWAFMQVWAVTGQMTGIDVAASAVGTLVGATVLGEPSGLGEDRKELAGTEEGHQFRRPTREKRPKGGTTPYLCRCRRSSAFVAAERHRAVASFVLRINATDGEA